MDTKLRYDCKPFSALSLEELYTLLALRQEVFIVEQDCPYLDNDGKDPASWHFLGWDAEGRLAAYARILPPGISYPQYPSIGRVATAPFARRNGYGKELMEQAIEALYRLFGRCPIKLSAQSYLLKFYESLGFHSTGEEYFEDDILHTAMIKE
ncbi:MAG: GNAT family N-acetyltransferase [Lewinellaceae bacterium]|nr:GNAT family N-acetyltransferase [Lewinellaceae bacterium]